MMQTTGSSRLTLGFPINYASILLAAIGIIFNIGLMYPYIDRIRSYTEWYSDSYSESNNITGPVLEALRAFIREITVLYIIVVSVHIVGILSRIGIIYASMQFKTIILRVAYILVALEVVIAIICSSIVIYRINVDMGPPIATLIGSLLQIYFIAVFVRTDQIIRNEGKTGGTGHPGARV